MPYRSDGAVYGFFRAEDPFGKVRLLDLQAVTCYAGGVLIHEHMDISASWTGWLIGTPSEHLGGFLIQLAESVLFIFFFGTAVDLLRGKCFMVLERMLARTSVGKKCASAVRHVDEIMKH